MKHLTKLETQIVAGGTYTNDLDPEVTRYIMDGATLYSGFMIMVEDAKKNPYEFGIVMASVGLSLFGMLLAFSSY